MDDEKCDKDVFNNGTCVFVTSTISTRGLNAWVAGLAEDSGQKVDWHWMGGRARVLALGDLDRVKAALRDGMNFHDDLYREAVRGLGMEAPDKIPHWWPDGDGEDIPSDRVRAEQEAASRPPEPEDTRLARTFACVEATGFEGLQLWRDHSTESTGRRGKAYDWKQDCAGLGITIGQIAKKPVVVSVRWATINNHLIMFYDVCSRMSDSKMVEKWLDENTPSCSPYNRTNAMNFHNVLHAIEYSNEAKRKASLTGNVTTA